MWISAMSAEAEHFFLKHGRYFNPRITKAFFTRLMTHRLKFLLYEYHINDQFSGGKEHVICVPTQSALSVLVSRKSDENPLLHSGLLWFDCI